MLWTRISCARKQMNSREKLMEIVSGAPSGGCQCNGRTKGERSGGDTVSINCHWNIEIEKKGATVNTPFRG